MDKYDVFLNHRGPDVKGGFIAHLYEALESVGLNAFLDKKSLLQGHPAFDSTDEALENARVQKNCCLERICGVEELPERTRGHDGKREASHSCIL